MKIELKLEKLTCAGCASKIEKRVNSLNFISSATLDFANQKLICEFEKEETSHVIMVVKKIVHDLEPKVVVKQILSKEDKLKNKEKEREREREKNNKDNNEKEEEDDDEDGDDGKDELKENIREIGLSLILLIIALVLNHTNLITDKVLNTNMMLVMYLLSYIICGREVIKNSITNIKSGEIFDENFLMLIATFGAFLIGEYFEGVLVMIFYKAGEAASDFAVTDSRKSIKSLLDLKVTSANLKTKDGYKKIDVDDVKVGDILIVKPGEKVPVDSVVVKGNSLIDTSSITGESVPRCANSGDMIYSGSINKSAIIEIEVKKVYSDSEVYKMIELIENSTAKKTNTEKFITKFARIYTPVVCLIAALLAIIPSVINGQIEMDFVYKALSFLVVSCPCALVLSVPLGYFAGVGLLSKEGILLKGTNVFETVCKTNAIAFDKTGTLTKGDFEVQEFVLEDDFNDNNNDKKINKDINITKEDIIRLSYMAEQNSNHPVAEAIKDYARDNKCDKYSQDEIIDASEHSGMGMKITVNLNKNEDKENKENKEIEFLIGNEKLLRENNIEFKETKKVGTILYLALNKKYIGYFLIADTIKEDSKAAILKINKIGIDKVVMLTGDNEDIAKNVAARLNIKEVHAKLMPNEKVEIVKSIKESGSNVMFVGDGMNDAPVMTMASSSVAMGSLGSDVSVEAADIIFMDDNINKVSRVISVSRRVRRVVLENIIFAIAIKLLVLALITLGFTNMLVAVLSDVGVTLIAVLNSIRILKFKDK